MKGFIGFLVGWAMFIIKLPDLLETLGKWVPILDSAGKKLTAAVIALIGVLPRAPECGNCRAFYFSWPTLVSLALAAAAYGLFLWAYVKLERGSVRDFLYKKLKLSSGILFFVGQFVVLLLVQTWLLHRYSGLTWAKALTIFTFNGRVAAAYDKNFFLHASNIYGLIIITSYMAIVLLLKWAWVYYQSHQDAKPPKFD